MFMQTSTEVCVALLLTITKTWKQPRCPSVGDGHTNRPIQTVGYHPAIKRNELIVHAATWGNLKCILLSSEGSQMQKATYYMIPFI